MTTLKCKNCGTEIELTEAFRHQFEEGVRLEEAKKYQEEIKSLRERAKQSETEELKIRQEKRQLIEAQEKFAIERERQLDEEREKIKSQAAKAVEEKDRFKFAEYEKKLADMSEALEVAKTKGKQGSQQLQGEVLELDFEQLLTTTFTDDQIVPVAKGQKGGDIIHKVRGKSGRVAGVILWETKRAKWSSTWLAKLREDARKENASVAVLIATNPPPEVTDFKLIEGVIVCQYQLALSLASILRRSILQIAVAKQTAAGKDENLELLYQYIQSEAFRHRFEAFAEGVIEMQNDLEYEKRAMERVWKKREMQIKKTEINAARMYGELQGVMGNALPDIKILSLPENTEKEWDNYSLQGRTLK